MKNSEQSLEASEKLFQECLKNIPGLRLHNRSITTSSIYCKTPDGYSLRIGDHKGKEKYSYKWNLNPNLSKKGYWSLEFNKITKRQHWRYYTGDVDDLLIMLKKYD